MKSNIFLIIKQGFKGVFKYKIQFIIIMILCFLSTFMISMSFSIQDRIDSTYNSVVKKVKPFDYTNTFTVNQKSAGTPNDGKFILLEDYQNDQYTNFTDGISIKNNYNFNIADSKFFWIDALNSSEFKTWWKEFANSTIAKNDMDETQKITSIKKFQNFGSKDDMLIVDSLAISTILNFQKVSNNSENKALIVEYYKKNDDLQKLINDINDVIKTPETYSAKIETFSNFINNKKLTIKEYNFLYNIFASSAWIMHIMQYNLLMYSQYISNDSNAVSAIKNNNIKQEENNAKLTYEFFFGLNYDDDKTSNNEWIGESDRTYTKFNSNSSDKIENYAQLSKTTNDTSSQFEKAVKAFSKKGLRGNLNPLILINENNKVTDSTTFNQDISIFSFEDNSIFENIQLNSEIDSNKNDILTALTKYDDSTTLREVFGTKLDPKDSNSGKLLGTSILLKTYINHIKYSADVSDFDIYIRREIIFTDPISQVQFRGVVLDPENQSNFTVLKGNSPTGYGEIAVSEQFAKKRGLQPGVPFSNSIISGNGRFNITALGTDAYSYYPISDPNLPIPQPKTSAIIYGSSSTISDMYIAINGLKTNPSATANFNIFLTRKKTNDDIEQNMNKYLAYQMSSTYNLNNNQKVLKDNSIKSTSFFEMSTFNQSNYRYSWTLQPMVKKMVISIVFAVSGLITIIAILILIICIRKTIHFNSKQIAILKAMGETPNNISLAYLSYSIIITLFILPIAWLCGNLSQMPLSIIFASYFSIQPNILILDWEALLISLIGIGLLSGIISYLYALKITNKTVIDILKNTTTWSRSIIIDFINTKLLKNRSFSTRFTLKLASSGRKTISLLILVTGVATLLTSIGLMIPALAQNAKEAYYKSIKYKNKFDFNDVSAVSNAPMAKTTVQYWKGQEDLENNWKDDTLQLDDKGTDYGYYQNPNNYTATVDSSSPISKYLYSKTNKDVNYTYTEILSSKLNDGFAGSIAKIFGENFDMQCGVGFSIGAIDKWLGLILNSLNKSEVSKVGGKVGDDASTWTDSQKEKYARDFSGFLVDSIPPLLSAILKNTGTTDKNQNWKKQIINVMSDSIPPYVKSFMKNDSRFETYLISWNTDMYIPEQETFTTTVDLNDKNNSVLSIQGLSNANTAYNLKKEDINKAFIDQKTIDKLESIIEGNSIPKDVIYNGIKLYNSETKTLKIPTIFNKQAEATLKTKKGDLISNLKTIKQDQLGINLLNSSGNYEYVAVPKYAWAYDDSDFANSDFYIQNYSNNIINYNNITGAKKFSNSNKGAKKWLDLYDLSNSKFTYNEMYTQKENKYELDDNSYLTDDFTYDENGIAQKAFIRPYYKFDNIKLFIPMNKIIKNYKSGSIKKNDGKFTGDSLSQLKNYFGTTWSSQDENQKWLDVVPGDEVPPNVQKAYGNSNGDYLSIQAYNMNDFSGLGVNKTPLTYITSDAYQSWLWNNYEKPGSNPPIKNIKANIELKNVDNIEIEEVGTSDSYNTKNIISDIKLANLLRGYSNSLTYGNDASLFKSKPTIKAGVNDSKYGLSQFDRYELKDISYVSDATDKLFIKDKNKAHELAVPSWHTGKLSNIIEPLALTSGFSYVVPTNVGLAYAGAGTTSNRYYFVNLYTSQTLLATSKALLDQISVLAIIIGVILVGSVVITAALLIMVVADIYISQYQRFMILMISLGYSKTKVRMYSFGIVTILSILIWILMSILAYVSLFGTTMIARKMGFAIPFGISWWPPVLCLLVIFSTFFGSLLFSSKKLTSNSPASLMNETYE